MQNYIGENKGILSKSDYCLEDGFILNWTKHFQWNITLTLFQNRWVEYYLRYEAKPWKKLQYDL